MRLEFKKRTKVMKEQGKALKDRRLKLELTQKEVGDAIGVHPQFVSNWERGLASVPFKRINDLGSALQMKNRELIQMHLKLYSKAMLDGAK